jgi:hypothetical protein
MPIALDAPTITLPSAGEILSAVGTGLKAAGEAALDFAGEAATGALGVVAVVLTPTQTMRDEDYLKPIPASTSQQGAVDTSPMAAKDKGQEKEHTSNQQTKNWNKHTKPRPGRSNTKDRQNPKFKPRTPPRPQDMDNSN